MTYPVTLGYDIISYQLTGKQMKLHVLFAQRHCDYADQYAPEALEIMDENGMDENADWMVIRKKNLEKSNVFTSVEIIEIDIGKEGGQRVFNILNKTETVKGSVVS